MSQYYCHQCAISNALIIPASPSSLTGNSYQLGKFLKHTIPSGSPQINSVFSDTTFDTYSGYTVTTIASGFLEIDHFGRKNLIWFAGSQVGVEYHNGIFHAPADGIKVVWPENDDKLHAFPITSSPPQTGICAGCGKPIPLY